MPERAGLTKGPAMSLYHVRVEIEPDRWEGPDSLDFAVRAASEDSAGEQAFNYVRDRALAVPTSFTVVGAIETVPAGVTAIWGFTEADLA